MKSYACILLCSFLVFCGCDMFSTRPPENPDSQGSVFLPPTSADVVISNLVNAFVAKNQDNYIACFADASLQDKFDFQFIPTASGLTQFGALFENWKKQDEQRYLNSLSANLPKEIKNVLLLSEQRFDILPDSTMFFAKYYIRTAHGMTTVPTEFQGSLSFTLVPNTAGLWKIKTWIDQKDPSDTIPDSWTSLKGYFYN